MRLFESFRAQQSGAEKSVFNRFLHFGPLRGPPVEMTKAQIIITIGIGACVRSYRSRFCHAEQSEASGI